MAQPSVYFTAKTMAEAEESTLFNGENDGPFQSADKTLESAST